MTHRIFLLVLPAALSAQLNQNCTVSVLNRNVQANPDGSWVLPNIPANMGQVKARATCVENGVTRSGESAFFTIPANTAVNLPDIPLGTAPLIPDSLTLAPATPTLNGVGQTVQITVTARYPNSTSRDVTAATAGTTYTTTNASMAAVSPNGLVTAVSSGTVVIQAINDGATGMATVKVVLSGDSDNDGIPNDLEIKLGLDPNNPVDALEDPDRDGLTNLQEINLGTDIRNPDTDTDGLKDGDEVTRGTNALIADTDGDLIPDGIEVQTGSNPLDRNSYDLSKALAAFTVTPPSFTLTLSTLFPQASQQLMVTGRLIDGKTTIDLTPTTRRTNYASDNLNVCNFGAPDGRVFAGQDGSCTITVTNSGFTAIATGAVRSFAPAPLSYVTIPGFANNVDVSGNYAYVAAGQTGLQVVDVTDHANPRIVASRDTPGNANDVIVAGNFAYVADGPAGLQIINISNPLAPVIAGSYDTPGDAQDVVVRGTRAYVADGAAGLQILDVTNPASPVRLGFLTTPGTAQGVDVDPTRQIAAIAAGGTGLHVVNVANTASPVLLATLPGGNVLDVALSGNFAFLADYSRSFTSVDLTNPSAPVLRGSTPAATGGLLTDVAVVGTFAAGADQFFVNGAPIIDVSTPASPVPRAIIDFRSFRDDDGTGIAMDASFVYLTAAKGDTRLYIGQYNFLEDKLGVPPTVRITSPVSGATVIQGATVPITVDATDDVAVAAVNFLVNGQVVFTDTSAPYQFTLTVPLGVSSLILGATALDLGGNIGTAQPVTLNVIPDPLTTVTGRVVNTSGQPVAGASVTVFTFSAMTGTAGVFTLPGVPTVLGNIVATATVVLNGVLLTGSSASVAPVASGTTALGDIVVGPDLINDNFNRPDGLVRNGWTSWWCGQLANPPESSLVGGEVRTLGCPNQAGGIYRSLPVNFPVEFSFDFRTADPPRGGWEITFGGEPVTSRPPNVPDAQISFYQYFGEQTINRVVKTRGTLVTDAASAPAGLRNYGPGQLATISGVINEGLGATITVRYRDGLLPDPVVFNFPERLGDVAPGNTFALGNSSAYNGPHFLDNVRVRAQSRPVSSPYFGPQAVRLNFDELPAGTLVGTTYQSRGVLFDNVFVDGRSQYAASPPNFIRTPDGDTRPVSIQFPNGVRRVGVQCDADGFNPGRLPQMRAFDAQGNVIGVQYCGQGTVFLGIESYNTLIHSVQLGTPGGSPGSFVSSDGYDNLIFEADGNDLFLPQKRFDVGIWPYASVTLADVNRDGRPDIVTPNFGTSDVSVLLGNGDGTFQADRRFPVGSSPRAATVGDVNGDGRPDIVAANGRTNDVSVFLGNGDGTFQAHRLFGAGPDKNAVTLADMNNDGRLDIITSNSTSSDVSVLLGNGDGTFQIERRFAVANRPRSVVAADLDGDGRLDLVTANASHDISVLPGNGDGTFQTQRPFSSGSGSDPYAAIVADVNGDGRPDIITANHGAGDVSVLLCDASLSFQPPRRFSVGPNPYSVAVADFNGDGRLDIVASMADFNPVADSDVSVLLGNGDGTFRAEQRFPVGYRPTAVTAGDVNGDGRPDIVTGNFGSHDVSILLRR